MRSGAPIVLLVLLFVVGWVGEVVLSAVFAVQHVPIP